MSLKNKLASLFRKTLTRISPIISTKVCYRINFGRKLNMQEPTTFNEKILWLKLNSYKNNALIKQCADKFRVRQFIEDQNMGSFLNRLIAVYDSPEDIMWEDLPNSFALKLNVGCGANLIVRSKSEISRSDAISKAKGWMNKKYWLNYAELQYKGVTPKLLVEDYIGDPSSSKLPMDYKFYCMNGVCQAILVCLDRGVDTGKAHHAVKYFFMDKEWMILPYTYEAIEYQGITIERPDCIDEAIEKAEKLAKFFPFVRVDFYIEKGQLLFGELTFTPAGGMDTELSMIPPGCKKSVDELFGEKLTLPVIPSR